MKTKTTLGIVLATIILLGLMTPLAKADTLNRTDFEQESFEKTVDYMEYVRPTPHSTASHNQLTSTSGTPTCT